MGLKKTSRKRQRRIGRNSIIEFGRKSFLIEPLEGRVLLTVTHSLADLRADLSGKLDLVENSINAFAYQNPVPVLGTFLKDFATGNGISDVVARFKKDILDAVNKLTDPAAVQKAIFNKLNPTGLLGDTNNSGQVGPGDVELSIDDDHGNWVRFHMLLRNDVKLVKFTLPFSTALPGLPLDSSAKPTVDIHVGFAANITFGFKETGEFFFDDTGSLKEFTADPQLKTIFQNQNPEGPFAIGIGAEPSAFNLAGSIGIFSGTITNTPAAKGNANNTNVSGYVALNSGYLNNSFSPIFSGSAHVSLKLSANLGPTDTGTQLTPSITSDFLLDMEYNNAPTKRPPSQFGALKTLEFDNTQISIGTFLGKVITPFVSQLKRVLSPLQPIVNILTTPIP